MNSILPLKNNKVNYDNIKDYLIEGSIILTNNNSSKTFIVTPSPIKHGAIFYGKNINKDIKKLYSDINQFLYYEDYNFFKPKENIIQNNPNLKNLKSLINIKLLSLKLKKEIDEKKYNDEKEYIIEISDKGPKIIEVNDFIKNKNDIFIYHYKRKYIMSKAKEKSLLFLATKYSFNKNQNSKYCFEMIIKCYELCDILFKNVWIYFVFNYHFNSLSITENKDFHLVYSNYTKR